MLSSHPETPNPDSETHQTLSFSDISFTIRNPPPLLQLDPNFFDEGYTLAAQTSSSIWEGAHTFLHHLSLYPELLNILQMNRCLELGTGTGVCGIAIGKVGGDVILTDIKSVLSVPKLNVDDNFELIESNDDGFCAGRILVEALDWTDEIDFESTFFSTAK